MVPKPVVDRREGARIGIVAYGSADPAVCEARDRMRAAGVETSYLRLRALPLEETLREFVEEHDVIYVVELNFDGQMRQLIQLYMPERAASIRSVAHCDGLPLTARFVAEAIMGKETNTNGHNG